MKYSLKKSTLKKPYKRRSVKKPTSTKQMITKICKNIVHRNSENKAWFDYGTNVVIPTASNSVPVYRNVLPLLAQGTGHSNRVGNSISVRNGYIKGRINILPYNPITNPFPVPVFVKMWLISSKIGNTNLLNLTNIATDFFDVVNGSVSFQGTMLDIDFSINKDAWTCHAQKLVKIGAGFTNTTLNLPVSGGGYFDNSPMTAPFYFNFTKHIKNLKYDDTLTACTNRNLFLIFQTINCDGSTPAGYTPAEMHYSIRVEYEDM